MKQEPLQGDSETNSDKKYRDLLEFAPDAFFQGDAEGNFLLVNTKAVTLTGYSKEELLSKTMAELFSNSDLNHRPLRYDLLNDEETVIVEREIVCKCGKRLPVEMSSKRNRDNTLQCFMRDLTEKKRQQNALVEIEKQYDQAIQTSPDSVTISDLNGVFKRTNLGFTNYLGYRSEEVVGRSVQDLGIWVSQEQRKRMINTLKAEGVVSGFEAEFRHKNGKIKTALLTCSLVDHNGSPHMLLVGKDLTMIKVFEQELKVAKEIAEQNDRLKSAFLANLSHEIRTPMNGILGFAELLKFPDIDEDTRAQYLDIIDRSGRHLLSIINDTIEIAKIETNQLQPTIIKTEMSSLLQDIKEQTQLSAEQQSKLTLNFQTDPLEIYTDQTKLKQILINLISNAVKFTDEGEISVSYNWTSKNLLSVSVTDTGIGIPKDKQHLVFDRFKQVAGDRNIQTGGSGLGLSISKAYVELLGGWIGCKSNLGQGSTFHFTIKSFPESNEPQSTASTSDTLSTNPRSSKFRILIVEDNEVNALLLMRLLNSWGFPYEHAINGQEAIEKCLKQTFQLVLMDIRLPGIDGVNALKEIRKRQPDLPMIAQTAHALQEEIQSFYDAGFDAYMTKPINNSELLRNIQSLM